MSIAHALIVAGGSGQRMGSETPKQFLPLAGRPVLMHTLEAFHRFDSNLSISLVLPEAHRETWSALCEQHNFQVPHRLVSGGETRFHSVHNGLEQLPNIGLVAIHDGVRPLVSDETIARTLRAAAEFGAAVPVVPPSSSLRVIDGSDSRSVDRAQYRLVQTPQAFSLAVLKAAFRQPYRDTFTDDASVVEAAGLKIALVEGNVENIKITTPADLRMAEALLS